MGWLIVGIILYQKMGEMHLQMETLVVLLLIGAAVSTSEFKYTFPFKHVQGDPFYKTKNYIYTPIYDLGILQVGYSIMIRVSIPNVASTTQMQDQYEDMGLFFTYYDSGVKYDVPALNGDGSVYQLPPLTMASYPFYEATYHVAFPPEYKIKAAAFKFLVNYDYDTYLEDLLFDYLYVEINYFKSQNDYSQANHNSLQTILKITESMRGDVLKIIYVQKPNSVFNLTVFPQNVMNEDGSVGRSPVVFLYRMNVAKTRLSGNEWSLSAMPEPNVQLLTDQEIAAGAGATPTYVNNTAHYTLTLESGYYMLELYVPHNGPITLTPTFTFQSDSYACPYDPEFPDVTQIFQGCVFEASPNSPPCLTYNQVQAFCTLCIPGYTLSNGKCLANTTCGARQFFHFGSCYNVSQACGSFDSFTGECLNCSDPQGYRLIEGVCVARDVRCGPRQWVSNFVCRAVSETCNTFEPTNGSCITCISNLYQLLANGSCVLINVTCPTGQYAIGLKCFTIQHQCSQFNSLLQTCLSCIYGFFLQNGTCMRIQCGSGKVPSKSGSDCVDVSSLCGSFDPQSGECLSCLESNYGVRNGKCVQIYSPLAGCRQRQHLGFGPCISADANCQTFNLIKGNCDACNAGFYLDYKGQCSPSAICSPGQWSVNGQCLVMGQNCIEVDSVGLCVKCMSGSFRIVMGQCLYLKNCQDHQYLNSGNQCVDVSPNCATWNPSNGECITCKDPTVQPISGFCCSSQLDTSKGCSGGSQNEAWSESNDKSCIIRHPSLRICLQCPPGYSPDYSINYACAPA